MLETRKSYEPWDEYFVGFDSMEPTDKVAVLEDVDYRPWGYWSELRERVYLDATGTEFIKAGGDWISLHWICRFAQSYWEEIAPTEPF